LKGVDHWAQIQYEDPSPAEKKEKKGLSEGGEVLAVASGEEERNQNSLCGLPSYWSILQLMKQR
jgi:hypothetical protein